MLVHCGHRRSIHTILRSLKPFVFCENISLEKRFTTVSIGIPWEPEAGFHRVFWKPTAQGTKAHSQFDNQCYKGVLRIAYAC